MVDLDMGAYAAFVWPAWGISAAVLAAMAVRAIVAARRWHAALRQIDKDDSRSRPQVARSAVGQPE